MTDGVGVTDTLRPSTPVRHRLVLADDHQEILDEVQRLLTPEFEVLGAVREGAALVRAAAETLPDIVVCDIRMPGTGGIEAGERILRGGFAKAVVVLSMYNEPHLVQKAFDAGIQGYVLKTDASEELIPAIYSTLAGEKYLSRGVREKWPERK